MNRRQFVVGSSAVVAAGVFAHQTLSTQHYGTIHAALFDTRFAPTREFGRVARTYGVDTHPIDGDITALWTEHLRPLWSRAGGAVVGMTTPSTLLCLEELARDHWHRVVAWVDHVPALDGSIDHHVHVRDESADRTRTLINAYRGFSGTAHAMLASAQARRGALETTSYRHRDSVQSDDRLPTLVTWTIAA
jgi:hypothetical protein